MNKELCELAKYFDWAAAIIAVVFFVLGVMLDRADHEAKAKPCPPCESQPFCQVMGSPVGGRMAQLPEGYGPHD